MEPQNVPRRRGPAYVDAERWALLGLSARLVVLVFVGDSVQPDPHRAHVDVGEVRRGDGGLHKGQDDPRARDRCRAEVGRDGCTHVVMVEIWR